MEEKILSIVDDINSSNNKILLEYSKLGNRFCIKEYSDTREPKLSIFSNIEECLRYVSNLKPLIKGSIKFSEEVDIEKYPFEVWYMGVLLGIFECATYEEACRKGLESKGVPNYIIDKEIRYCQYKFFKSF